MSHYAGQKPIYPPPGDPEDPDSEADDPCLEEDWERDEFDDTDHFDLDDDEPAL